MNLIFSRTLKALCSLTAVAMLSACGGASSTVRPLTEYVTPTIAGSRIIAFGDALSDVGNTLGGGRYTVNDGGAGGSMTLAERLAANFGFASVTPVTSGVLTGGAYSYAYGGALISSGAGSVASQIDAFVDAGNQLTDNDLVIITAGQQDIVYNATEFYATRMTAAQAKDNVATAAATLVTKVRRLTDEAHAKHVLVIAPFNVARTPWGLSQGANYPSSSANYTFLEHLSVALEGDNSAGSFGSQLALRLGNAYPSTSSGLKVFLADLSSYFNLMTGTGAGSSDVYGRAFPHPTGSLNTYSSYLTAAAVALTNPDVPVCVASVSGTIVTPVTTTTCTTGTITDRVVGTPWDYNSSVFADDLNLTPAAHRILADYIFNSSGMGTMRTAGWR
jgi:phospholipase/lecithinase/hemolysin